MIRYNETADLTITVNKPKVKPVSHSMSADEKKRIYDRNLGRVRK